MSEHSVTQATSAGAALGPAPLLRPQPDPRPSFASYGLIGDLADWGWVYQTENNGKWINASTGNLGDITG